MIKIPGKIESVLKVQILNNYRETIKSLTPQDVSFILTKMPRIIQRLKNHPGAWPEPVGIVASVFLSELSHMKMRRSTVLPSSAVLAIIGALRYLCNVDDVIPDYTPGIGYYDDALVLNECLQVIRKTDRTQFERIIKLIQESESEDV